jgi:hypothetical protein
MGSAAAVESQFAGMGLAVAGDGSGDSQAQLTAEQRERSGLRGLLLTRPSATSASKRACGA